MSTREQKMDAPRVSIKALSLREQIEAAGVAVPDQAIARRMMTASLLGLQADASARRLFLSSWRLPFVEKWTFFSPQTYAAQAPGRYGAPMPPVIAERVSKVVTAIPHNRVRIHALSKDDPWVEVVNGEESLFIGGWMRNGDYVRILL